MTPETDRQSIEARTGLQPLLTVSELAVLAGQSTRTIERRIADGSIPARRFGRSIRLTRRAALSYLGVGAIRDRRLVLPGESRKGVDQMQGYRVRMREVVEYDVMLAASSPEDAKMLAELESRELDGFSPIEDGTPEETISKRAIAVEPYPSLDE